MKKTLASFIILPFFVSVLSGGLAHAEAEPFTALFDGKTLEGWSPTPGGKWVVQDGAIVGTSEKSEKRHGILLTDREFTDFVARAKFRVIRGDSGFYFRAGTTKNQTGVKGFQAEVDTSQETGGLYETGGRAWVHKPTAEVIKKRSYKPGEWTDLEVSAIGGNIVVKINGVVSSELKNDKGRRKGHFGLQLHGGQDMHVEYRDIMIREIAEADSFVPMFNGKDLSGWKTKGNWVVEQGNIVTLKPRPGETGWKRFADYIMTERKYGDFILDLDFKFESEGNSGVFMRVSDPLDPVESGFEIQILDTHGKKDFGHHDCGGLIRASAPSKMVVKAAGEWNHYTITLKDSHLKAALNGTPIQDLDLSKTTMKDRPMEGYIGFQDEAKRVWYRNVRIKELK